MANLPPGFVLDEEPSSPPPGFVFDAPAPQSALNPLQPGPEARKQSAATALKIGGGILGSLLAPQMELPAAAGLATRLAMPALNLGGRMLGAGTGAMTGGAAGEEIKGESPTFSQMGEDFKQGAIAEAVGTTVALPVKLFAKGAGWGIRKLTGKAGQVAEAAAEEGGIRAGKWAFDRLTRAMGGNDAPIPAPATLKVVQEELIDPQTKGWNPLARKLFGADTKAPPGAKTAMETGLSGAPPRIGGTTAWEVTPRPVDPQYASVRPLGADWKPLYVVHADGGAELFFHNENMGLFRPTGTSGKVAKELLTEDQLLRYVGAQRSGVPAVGVVEATPATDGRFVSRGRLFDVTRRDDAIPWRDLNDLSAKFRTRDLTNLSKEEIDTFMRLRDAIGQDVTNHSPAAARWWDLAWKAYRFGRDPIGQTGKALAQGVVKPAVMGGVISMQPSHKARK